MPASSSTLKPLSGSVSADDLYDAFVKWAEGHGTTLYGHQDEALMEIVSGNNLIIATPTGSGKSLVALAAHFVALSTDRVSFYTAPIKALVSEKFFALCDVFGADNVGMITGDASVNSEAPIICCTAEILANIALREGPGADVGLVIADEFHFYAEPGRGWAWQVPLLTLPGAQFVLMSATLGPTERFVEALDTLTGRPTLVVADAQRPVPLNYAWVETPLAETLDELIATHQAPVYVIHFTQADAVSHATSLKPTKLISTEEKQQIADHLGAFRFSAGFGKTLSRLVRNGIGVHHAGMLPRYRRVVERLASRGLLKIICGTDTLGVGINVPIRTVLFTGLAKYDGSRSRVLKIREFQQIAGRAGRAGYDTVGHVIVQAPEHLIENARRVKKAGDDPKRLSRVQRVKAEPGSIVWTPETFTKLVEGTPETLVSRMKMDNSMLINLLARDEDTFLLARALIEASHEDQRGKAKLTDRTQDLARALVRAGIITPIQGPIEEGRPRYDVAVELPDAFALNQPLSMFALAALDLIDDGDEDALINLVSVVEAVVAAPRQILFAQRNVAKGEAISAMKADGVEYDERMQLLDEVMWPQPLNELLTAAFETYRQTHPWLPEDGLEPKSIVRQMYTEAMSFTDFVSRYQLARSEGLVLRYLSDAYRALLQTVPQSRRTDEFEDLTAWLRETIAQTDSSLIDEWEALTSPDPVQAHESAAQPISRPLSKQTRVLKVMVRNALFRRVELCARDDLAALVALDTADAQRFDPPREPVMTRAAWDRSLEQYYSEHDRLLADADARGPSLLSITEGATSWQIQQTLHDPSAHHDWVIEANLDVQATDETGEPALVVTAMRQL